MCDCISALSKTLHDELSKKSQVIDVFFDIGLITNRTHTQRRIVIKVPYTYQYITKAGTTHKKSSYLLPKFCPFCGQPVDYQEAAP